MPGSVCHPMAWYEWAGQRRSVVRLGTRWLMACPGCGDIGWLPECYQVVVGEEGALTVTPGRPLYDGAHDGIGCLRCGWRATIAAGHAIDTRALEDRRVPCVVC